MGACCQICGNDRGYWMLKYPFVNKGAAVCVRGHVRLWVGMWKAAGK
jgi:hypothetical protein